MLHSFEYAWSITVREMLALPITKGVPQVHSGNSGVHFPNFHIPSTWFDFYTLLISLDFACLFLEKVFVREVFLQRESGWEEM